MKYLTFLTALLLSTTTFAQEPPSFYQTEKPVICGPLQQILGAVASVREEPYAYWDDPANKVVVLMFVGEQGGVTIIESFNSGDACIVAAGKEINFLKKGIDS